MPKDEGYCFHPRKWYTTNTNLENVANPSNMGIMFIVHTNKLDYLNRLTEMSILNTKLVPSYKPGVVAVVKEVSPFRPQPDNQLSKTSADVPETMSSVEWFELPQPSQTCKRFTWRNSQTLVCHVSIIRYIKLRITHAPGMPGTFSRHRLQRKLTVSDSGIHHGTCVTHVPWCISGSLTVAGQTFLAFQTILRTCKWPV